MPFASHSLIKTTLLSQCSMAKILSRASSFTCNGYGIEHSVGCLVMRGPCYNDFKEECQPMHRDCCI